MATRKDIMKRIFLDYIREGDVATRIHELDGAPYWKIPGTVWSRLALKVFGRSRDKDRRNIYNYWRIKTACIRQEVLEQLAKETAPKDACEDAELPPEPGSVWGLLAKKVCGKSHHKNRKVVYNFWRVKAKSSRPEVLKELTKDSTPIQSPGEATLPPAHNSEWEGLLKLSKGLSSHRLSDVDVGVRLEVPDEAAKSNKGQCTCVMCYTSHCLPDVGEGVHLEMLKKEVPLSPGHDLKSAHFTRSEVFCGVEHSKRKTAAERNCEQSHETRVSSFENSTKMKNEIDSEFDASDKMAGTSWSMLDITDIHEQEENFCICDECGQMFTRPWLLKQHQKSLHLREFENLLYKCSFCSLRYDTEVGLREHAKSLHASELEEIKQESKELFGELSSPQDHRENDKGSVWYYGNYCLKDLRVCLERISMKTIAVNKELVCETADHKAPASGQQNLKVFVDGFQENCTDSPLLRVNCRKEVDVSTFESSLLTSGNDANLEVSKSIASEREDSDLPEDLESDVLVGATDKVENGISSVIPMESCNTKTVPQPKKILERFGHNNCLERFITSFGYENPSRNESLLKTTNSVFLEMPTEGQYVCPVCGDRFARRVQLELHSRLHKQSVGVQQKDDLCHCSICGLKFQYLYALRKHVVDNHGLEALASNVSGNNDSESQAVNEQRSANYQPSQNLYPFINNRVAFTRLLLIRNHQLSNKQSKKKKCTHCGLMYDGHESLKKHYRLHEAAKDSTNSLNQLAKVQNGQLGQVQSGELHVPLDCQKNNGSSGGIITFLEEPNRTAENSPNTVQNDALPYECKDGRVQYSCDFCPSVWNSPSLLLLHMQMYHKVDPSQENRLCEDCGISFDSIESFEEHKMKHLIEKLVEENAGVMQQAFTRRDPNYTEARVIHGGGTEPVGSTSETTNSNGCIPVEQVINGRATETVRSTFDSPNNNGCVAVAQVINGGVAQVVNGGVAYIINGGVAQVFNGGVAHVINGGVPHVINGRGTEPVGSTLDNTYNNGCVAVAQVINGGVAQVINGGVAYIINGGVAYVINGGVAHVVNGGVAHVSNGGVAHVITGGGTESVGSTSDNTNDNGDPSFIETPQEMPEERPQEMSEETRQETPQEMPQETAKVVPKRGYVCDQCDERFEDNFTKLLQHRLSHGEEGVALPQFWCLSCGHGSHTADELELHLKGHTYHRRKKGDKGNKYGRDFLYIADLRNCLSASNDKIFACDKCNRGYSTVTSLQLHLYKHGEKRLKCDRCPKTFHFPRELNAHKLSHVGQHLCTCSVCGKGLAGKGALKMHMYIHTGEFPYKCSVCPRAFRSAGNLKTHSLVHLDDAERTKHGTKPVQCSICNKTLSCRSSLKIHLVLHQGVKPHICTLCRKPFALAGGLRIHMMQRHSDERPFPCCVCDKSFKAKSDLKLHLVLHSRPGTKHDCKYPDDRCAFAKNVRAKTFRVHACPLCGKACPNQSKLKSHMQIHDKEAVACSCSVCGKVFRHTHSLAVHMRLHTGDKPYGCKVCGKRFTQAGNLSVHLRMHTGERPYQCKICLRPFRYLSWMKIHLKAHKSLELIDAPEYRVQRQILHKDLNGKIINNGSEQKNKSNKKTKQRDLEKARLSQEEASPSQAKASLPHPTTFLSQTAIEENDYYPCGLDVSNDKASLSHAKVRLSQDKASFFQTEASLPDPTTYPSRTAIEESDYYPCGLDVPNECVGEYLDASNNGISECFPHGNEVLFADCEQPGEPIYEEIVG